MSLAGPLRLRFDYRVFTLQGDAAVCEAAAVLRGAQSEVLTDRRRTRDKPQPDGCGFCRTSIAGGRRGA